ncbi:hypothetical protein DFO66_10757 [Brevibacterium sanguinis]|uniref:N-acetyltransferase domain-containing protein n=2 Tax=Brevibacterium TaxID=1696 RepID=A0A366IIT7_9MICO|nr:MULTISPECIES: GNAT family N-acetyltransferase [Brevibacterium]RBP64181.1 hypothetical protein DFO66_10757 [Brevibacterium sanguinis]RBP71527.1 hypothetical protein DFO65_105127 [Brevibacterium celere]
MQPELNPTPVTVTKHPERDRFEMVTTEDPVTFIGFLGYRVVDDTTLELQHTIISEDFSRRGFARTLVTHVLDQIRSEGGAIIPTCSYVQEYLRRFPQYRDLIAE